LGGVLLTPDLPMMGFWFIAFILFSRIVVYASKSARGIQTSSHLSLGILAALLGLCLGLGFSSKYMMVLFGAFLSIWYLLVFAYDRTLFNKIPLRNLSLIIIFGLIGSLPTVWWNFKNNWISFSFQMNHGFGGPSFDWSWPFNYIAGSSLLSLPFLYYVFFPPLSLDRFYREAQHIKWILIFAIFCALGPFIFFMKSSLYGHVELNWPAMAYPFLITLALIRSISKKVLFAYIFFLWGAMGSILVLVHTEPEIIPGKVFKEMVSLRERAQLAKKFSPLWTCDYQSASLFSFYSGENVFKIPGCSRFDFYDTRPEFEIPPNISRFYLYSHEEQKVPTRFQVKSEKILETFPEGWSIKELELVR